MKTILVIGDIHGRTIWKTFADIKFLLTAEFENAGCHPFIPDFDKIIFLGDYCDAYTVDNDTIRENLLEIIRFKTLYPKNVILLWGNHDVQYYNNLPWQPMMNAITGFRPEMHYDLYEIFNKNKNLFQLAFQVENYIFLHGGLHKGWYHYVFAKYIKDLNLFDMTIAEQLNEAFDRNVDCIFDVDHYRGGYKKVGGPLWISKQLLDKKPLMNIHQCVGHTPVDYITTIKINDATTVTYCDILAKKTGYYVINI